MGITNAMIGDLITLPLRLTVRTASFFLRGSEEVLKRGLALTGRTVSAEPRYEAPAADGEADHDEHQRNGASAPEAPRPTAEAPGQTAAPPPPTAPPQRVREPDEPEVPSEPEPLIEGPVHVSEEPVLVEEFAEPGAEDGAGAEVTISEPWEGYGRMSAKEVIARLGRTDPATLAAVDLYENAHHGRQTVLSAVERQLRLTTRGGASD